MFYSYPGAWAHVKVGEMSSEWKPSLIPVLKFAHRVEQLPSRSFLPHPTSPGAKEQIGV